MFPVPSHVYPELQGQEVKCRASTSGLRGSTIQPDKCSYSLLVSDLFFFTQSDECLFHEDSEYIGIWIYYGVWICS